MTELAYSPVDITPPELQPEGIAASVAEGWAEGVTDPRTIDYTPRQERALIPFEVVDGLPLNPMGRTGKTGRNLGWWGENAAADPIVIADTPDGPRVLLIQRDDCGQWAIPGGMVDPGETAPAALVRELKEETSVDLAATEPEILDRTYVDDPRNSDHAWVASTVALYRLPGERLAVAGDDAAAARWWPATSLEELDRALEAEGYQLYEAHAPLLQLVMPPLAPPSAPRLTERTNALPMTATNHEKELAELLRHIEELNKEIERKDDYLEELEGVVIDAAVASETGTEKDGMAVISEYVGDSELWDAFQEKLNG